MKVDIEKRLWGEGLGFQRQSTLPNTDTYRILHIYCFHWVGFDLQQFWSFYPVSPHIKTWILRWILFISAEYYRSIQVFCYLEHQYFSVPEQWRRSSNSGGIRLDLLLRMVFERISYIDFSRRGRSAKFASKQLHLLNFAISANFSTGSIERLHHRCFDRKIIFCRIIWN